ncbi:MAG: SpoVR family protein [Deltaproteobacteria bacterium]|nr:SpoVR family protein [Deltaproteobacteria bacterium]
MSLPLELAKLKDEIKGYARGFGLDFFEVIFEFLDYDQLNAVASLGGFPVRYPHWRFGMEYDQLSKTYTYGLQKIYELVINNSPSYAYLMKSNAMIDQKLVMAHVYAHVDFFKNNVWFSKTNRKMIDSMANHAVKIRGYMDRYGVDRVEGFIDKCLSLENLIDPFLPFAPKKHPPREDEAEKKKEVGRLKVDRQYLDKFVNPPEFIEEQRKKLQAQEVKEKRDPSEPQKDVLQYLLRNAPLEGWENDILAMAREEAYYYAPQWQTKIMNEGWASYWHSRIMTEKALKDSEIIDFADHHSGVMSMQPGKVNPYKIGVELYRDIEERWNTGRFGKEWDECNDIVVKKNWDRKLGLGRQKIFEVRRVCNDVTFIDEYLTPEFCERFKLYTYQFNRRTNQYEIADRDFKKIKEKLLFGLANMGQPFVYVADGNYLNKGELLLLHKHQGVDLDSRWTRETLKNVGEIWRRPANLETEVDGQKKLITYAPSPTVSGAGECSEKFL